MPVFKGSGTGTITSTAKNIASTINSFSIVNGSAGNITITITIGDNIAEVPITAIDYTLKPNQAYIRDSQILVLPGNFINIYTSDTVYYYFSIS